MQWKLPSEPIASPQINAEFAVVFADFQTCMAADIVGLLLGQNDGGYKKNDTVPILRQRPETLDPC